jgi:hypothetical protein
MITIRDIGKELFGMFLADSALSVPIIILVALVAVLTNVLRGATGAAGALLLFGSLAVLVTAVHREARRRQRQG